MRDRPGIGPGFGFGIGPYFWMSVAISLRSRLSIVPGEMEGRYMGGLGEIEGR